MTTQRRGRRTLVVGGVLAALGAGLAVDASLRGGLWRYELVAYTVAASLALPLASRLLFGPRVGRWWRNLAFAAVPLAACLLLGELLVRWLGPVREPPMRLLRDARLGHRVVPGTGGTDAHGFRNDVALDRCDVLLIGDSQTWGFAVPPEQTFTARLAAATGVRCYQMANGSYGPVQYRELLRQGLPLSPELVVVAIYYGNDLIDATDYAGLEGAGDLRSSGRRYEVRTTPELDGKAAPNLTMAAVDAVLAASALLDAASAVVKSRLRGGALDAQEGALPFEHATAPTILLPDYRFPAVDADNEWVQEGLAVTARSLADVAARCAGAGARCVVVTIPTKERCYARWQLLPELERLLAAERRVRDQLVAAAAAAGLELVESCPALVAAMQRGEAPWFASGDGHLNATGHEVVAELLRERWRR